MLENNITKHKQAEKALAESEEKFRITLKNSPIVVWNQDKDLRYTWIYNPNPGFKPEETIGKTDKELLPADDAEKLMQLKRKVLKSGIGTREETKTTIQGNDHYYDLTVEPLLDSNNTIIGITCVAIDITSRKKAEQELKVSEERYRTVFENTGTATVILEENRTISLANGEFIRLSGYSKEEIENRMKWTEFVVSEDLERMKKYHLARRKTGGKAPSEYEFCFRDKKGNIKNIFLKISIIPGTKKSVSSLMDITERKQAEEKLKKTMDATLETMSKIIEVKDPYTAGHQQRVSQLAVSISKELNFLQEQVEGIKIASLIHDIGKIGIPTEILNKSIALSDIEFSLIKAHSQIGYDILKSIDFSYPVAEIVLQHHEKIDGSGYPKGLKGDDISLEAKIICVADVVEAMSSHRPYRPALGSDKALEEISKNKGILYDTIVVNACVKLFKEKGFKWE